MKKVTKFGKNCVFFFILRKNEPFDVMFWIIFWYPCGILRLAIPIPTSQKIWIRKYDPFFIRPMKCFQSQKNGAIFESIHHTLVIDIWFSLYYCPVHKTYAHAIIKCCLNDTMTFHYDKCLVWKKDFNTIIVLLYYYTDGIFLLFISR